MKSTFMESRAWVLLASVAGGVGPVRSSGLSAAVVVRSAEV